MSSDGHTGTGYREASKGDSKDFSLILSYLQQGNGRGDFVIHATSNKYYSYGLQPKEFLRSIGFSEYQGQCPYHQDQCFYRVFASLKRDRDGFENRSQTQQIYNAFASFSSKIDNLFKIRQSERDILSGIGVEISGRNIFNAPIEVEIEDADIPLWVEEIKLQRLIELERQVENLQVEIASLSQYLPLVYGTGKLLENAVIKAVEFLGMKAELAPKGFTVDVLAQTVDGAKKFGFEITGLNGAIRKSSNKLTQVLDFERIKENQEKTILLANTYSDKPISERKNLEDFTQPVIDFLGRHPILMMTGWNLYCMIRDVLEERCTKEEIIEILFSSENQLHYN